VLEAGLWLVSLALYLLLPTLLDGVERKIRAAIHSRIGPPITQSWLDVFKLLFDKELVLPPNSLQAVILVSISFTLQAALMIMLAHYLLNISESLELIALLDLYAIAQAVFVSVAFTTPNPFAAIGASREAVLMLVNEVFFFAFVAVYMYRHYAMYGGQFSLGLVACTIAVLAGLLIVSYVASARIPFDIAEAEPELASGIMVELSGPLLGLFTLTIHLRRFFIKLFTAALLILVFTRETLVIVSGSIALAMGMWLVYAVVAAMLGRSRVDVAPITLLKIYSSLLVLALIGCFLGF